MLREISEEVRINLKDRLRDVRHAIRQRRHDSTSSGSASPAPGHAPFPLREIEGLLGHAASAFDDVMSMAETLVPRELSGRMQGLAPKPLGTYFGARGASAQLAAERAFRRDIYALTRAVLKEKGREARVHEAALAAAHAAMERQYGELFDRLSTEGEWTARVALTASLSAALLLELLGQDPLRFGDQASATMETGGRRAGAISCLAPVALACGMATVDTSAAEEPDLLEIAMLATDARLPRILPACEGADAQDELTSIFAALLAHLP